MDPKPYSELARQEAAHWGSVDGDPGNPQIWDDPLLLDLFFGRETRRLMATVSAHGRRVLELGSGDGTFSLDLARGGADVTGLDLSPERVEQARRRAEAGGLSSRARFRVADLNTVTLEPGAYSCVVAHDALHHILEIDRLLEQVWNGLEDGGCLVVMDYQGMSRWRRLLAAGLAAILPTYVPYRAKWGYRKRLRSFMATEAGKRSALRGGDAKLLHPESPFEEITQETLIPRISRRFAVRHLHTYLPFWFYLAPKVRIPRGMKGMWARGTRALDDLWTRMGAPGAYFYMEVTKEGAPNEGLDRAPGEH